MKANRKITSSEKKLFLVTAFAIAFMVAFGAWRQWINAIPEVEISTPKMPSPNAHDFYVQAGKSLASANAINNIADGVVYLRASDRTRAATSADRISILQANSKALALFRQGSKFQYQEPNYQLNQVAPSYSANFRLIANLLVIQGLEHEQQH